MGVAFLAMTAACTSENKATATDTTMAQQW